MHASNLLQPWIALRLVAGLVAVVLFLRGGRTSLKVLRAFDLARATEGQLALERQMDLASTLVRVATVVQVSLLALTMLSADRMSTGIRGAMCGYGVFGASAWGFPSLYATVGVALVAGIVSQLYAFDARVRSFDLARPLARVTLLLAPLALIDFAMAVRFSLDLDLSVVASCCSVQLDAAAAGISQSASVGSSRALATMAAPIAIVASVVVAWLASRKPRALTIVLAGALSLFAFPIAIAASVLEVAPHAFELPSHVCPFCLLKPNVLAMGYPLFGAIFLAVVWGAGAAVSALFARTDASRAALADFARVRLRRESVAWLAALALGLVPIVRYAIVSHGASLFP